MLNCLASTPHFKDQRFSTRRDVVNKTIFRIMKRYYIKLFKTRFPKLKPKANNLEAYLEASETLLESLEGPISTERHLKFFIAQMVSTKLASSFAVDSDVEQSLKLLDT